MRYSTAENKITEIFGRSLWYERNLFDVTLKNVEIRFEADIA